MSQTNSRERLLEIAEALFAEQGYLATSVREIVQGAGVQPPALYYHFENKEALLVELLTQRFDAYEQSLRERLVQAHKPDEAFLAFVTHAFDRLETQSNSVRFVFGVLYGPQHGIPRKLVRNLQLRYHSIVAERVRALDPAIDEQRVIFAVTALQGMTLSLTLRAFTVRTAAFPKELAPAIASRAAAMLYDGLPVPALGIPPR
jgi:AcrR family transcriptional regulator